MDQDSAESKTAYFADTHIERLWAINCDPDVRESIQAHLRYVETCSKSGDRLSKEGVVDQARSEIVKSNFSLGLLGEENKFNDMAEVVHERKEEYILGFLYKMLVDYSRSGRIEDVVRFNYYRYEGLTGAGLAIFDIMCKALGVVIPDKHSREDMRSASIFLNTIFTPIILSYHDETMSTGAEITSDQYKTLGDKSVLEENDDSPMVDIKEGGMEIKLITPKKYYRVARLSGHSFVALVSKYSEAYTKDLVIAGLALSNNLIEYCNRIGLDENVTPEQSVFFGHYTFRTHPSRILMEAVESLVSACGMLTTEVVSNYDDPYRLCEEIVKQRLPSKLARGLVPANLGAPERQRSLPHPINQVKISPSGTLSLSEDWIKYFRYTHSRFANKSSSNTEYGTGCPVAVAIDDKTKTSGVDILGLVYIEFLRKAKEHSSKRP